MTEHVNHKASPKVQHPTLLGTVVSAFFNLLLISLLAWLLLATWFIGESFLKGEETALIHAHSLLLSHLQSIGSHPLLGQHYFFHILNTIQEKLSGWNHFNFSQIPIIQITGQLLAAITTVDCIRIMLFVLALPLFALISMVCITDGLVKRDIRKFQGARESTFIFHRMKYLKGFCFFVPLLIYFSLPFYITPTIFLITQAMILGLIFGTSATYFKKYL